MSRIKQYRQTRQYTESLCSPLSVEDYIPQIVDYASPPKWHLAHTSWFFEEMILKKFAPDYREFDPAFGYLFNSYYNHVGERLARSSRGNITTPDVRDIYRYRHYIDKQMLELLSGHVTDEVEALTVLGINHEQQHQELLLTDLKYSFGHNPVYPAYAIEESLSDGTNPESGDIRIEGGLYEVGHGGEDFHFDNERGRHKVYLNSFSIDRGLVTNGDYMEFIEAGGYREFGHWLDDGWSWLRQNGVQAPLYWHRINGDWHHYTFNGVKPVNPDAILCHISFYEANAFAAWQGRRLPTEFEWEVACEKFQWGQRWEWTNSAYLPYPGFSISKDAVGEYNGKFMINQMVLRGASAATPPGHSRKTYRNFFHPHLQWQFSGIRLAQ